jgi:hypothetical protein
MEMTEFKFPQKRVSLRPISRKGGWLPANHDGNFMFTNTNANYVVPIDTHGNLRLEATDEELKALEKAFSLPEGSLNPNRPDKDNFWKSFKTSLKLSKEGMTLNLSNPNDYKLYIIAKSNPELIAPDWNSRLDKGTYKFAIVDEADITKAKAEEADVNSEVWTAFGAISTSDTKMRNVLQILNMGSNIKVSKSASSDFLKSELKKFAEKDPRKLLSVVKDPDFTLKADILSAVDVKAITKDGLKYYITGQPDAKMTFDALVEYLKNPENQDILLEIKERIKS